MDSNRLRYFIAVSETGSIRKASEILHLSPAALSKAIKLFESEAGINLLIPSGRGIAITDEGRELARLGKPLLQSFDQLAKGIKERKHLELKSGRPIHLGSFEVFTTHFLSGLLQFLPQDSDLLLREVIPGEMEKALVDREIDFGITYIPIPTSGIDFQQITIIDMGIFGLAENFSDKSFDELPFVVPISPISGSPNKVQGLDGWPDDKISRSVKYRVTMMESALELCRKGVAVAYLPSFIVGLHNHTVKSKFQLQAIRPPKGLSPQKQDVFIARRKSEPEAAIYKKIAHAIRMICK